MRGQNGWDCENPLLLEIKVISPRRDFLVYNIAYFLVSYPAGRLSDKIGRKKLLVIGYIFYGVEPIRILIVEKEDHLLEPRQGVRTMA